MAGGLVARPVLRGEDLTEQQQAACAAAVCIRGLQPAGDAGGSEDLRIFANTRTVAENFVAVLNSGLARFSGFRFHRMAEDGGLMYQYGCALIGAAEGYVEHGSKFPGQF